MHFRIANGILVCFEPNCSRQTVTTVAHVIVPFATRFASRRLGIRRHLGIVSPFGRRFDLRTGRLACANGEGGGDGGCLGVRHGPLDSSAARPYGIWITNDPDLMGPECLSV